MCEKIEKKEPQPANDKVVSVETLVMPTLPCICEGNWRLIINETSKKIGEKFKDKRDQKEYTFYGVVHGRDDYYYGMCDDDGKCLLLSCVGDIEGHGFVLKA